jgi:Flagellar hook-length control protein FliK
VSAALTRAGVASAVPSTEAATPPAATDLDTTLVALRQVLKTWVDQQPDTRAASEASNAAAPQTSARLNVPIQPYRGAVNVPQAPALTLLAMAVPVREQTNRVLLQTNPGAKTAPDLPNAAAPEVALRSTATNTPMPPYRGAPDVPQAPAAASLPSAASPREQAIHLLSQTDAAIARQTLLRIVSLPGEPAGASNTQHSNDNATRVMFEIPIATAQGTGVAPMTIAHDRGNANAAEGLKSWLVRFSIDLPEIGPVHARIALTGERATVTLNAERTESAQLLAAGLPLLDAGLRGAHLEPGELRCRAGGANAAGTARTQPAAPGMFVDQAS